MCIRDRIYVEPLGRANTSMALSASEEVGIKIINLGTEAMSNFDVYFQVDNGSIVSENIPATIPSGDSLIYTFTGTGDLSSAGIHNIDAWLHHPQNTEYANDTLVGLVTAEQFLDS